MDRALPDSLSQEGTRGCCHQGGGTVVSPGCFGAPLPGASSGSSSSVESLGEGLGDSIPVIGHHPVSTPNPHPPNPRRPARESQAPTALPTGFHGNGSSLQGGLGRRAGSSEKPQISLLFIFLHSHLFSEPEFLSVLMF